MLAINYSNQKGLKFYKVSFAHNPYLLLTRELTVLLPMVLVCESLYDSCCKRESDRKSEFECEDTKPTLLRIFFLF